MDKDIWIFLFGLGLALFSWPIMSLFREHLIPYLFVAWAVFIGLIGLAMIAGRSRGAR